MRRCARSIVFVLVLAGVLFCPVPSTYAVIVNGENAKDLLGQFSTQSTDTTPSYTTHCIENGASPIGFANNAGIQSNQIPYGVAFDFTNHWLFATDSYNGRILVFPLNSSTNLVSSKTPSYYLNVSSSISCVPLTNFYDPAGLAVDPVNHWLYAGASYNGVVYVFNTSSMSTGETPSYVLGDTSMGNYTTGTTQSKMNGPTALALDVANQLLYVADSGNNRVMVFPAKGNASWGGNGENALYELGVPNGAGDFTTQGSAAATQSTFGPVGLAYDSTNQLLYVSDGNNNRVLVFPAYGNGSWGGNGENATYVLGQSNFTNNSINEGNNNYYPSQSSMWYPSDVAVDPAHNLVYVGDMTNGRIMVFSTVSLSNGENATAVLGEPNFVTGWRNQGSGGNTSRSLMDGPAGLAIDPTNQLLYSSDLIDSRILEFNVSSLPNAQFSTVTQNGNDGCAISSLGALYCWGNNQWGEDGLGNQSTALNTNSTNFIFAPQQVGTATNWTVISQAIGTDNNIYDAAGCGVAGGALYCMGNNAYGELGVGNTTQYYSPQQVGSATNWTAVSTSGTDTCGIAGGKLYCWGENLYGEVGNGAPNSNAVFVTSTTTNGGFGSVTAANTACQNASTTGGSIAPAGTYLAWASTIKTGNTGANDPYTTFTNKTLPYKDVAGNLIAASWNGLLSGTLLHGITLDQTGTTQSGVAWTNVSGTSGQASTNGSSTTKNCAAWTVGTSGDSGNTGTLGSTSSTWSKSSSTSACNTAAHLLCFEQSTATNEVTSPVQIGSDTTWTVISQGGYDTCGIDNGKLYCWGRNSAGELGLGNTTEYTTPQQVGVATNWIAVSQGGQDTCGIRGSSGSGALYCWGGNFNGELGLGNSTSYTTPQQVGTDTTWTAISVNNIDNGWNGDACGIDNGKLYCSGYNNNGQLGLGNTTNYNTFQQVGALTTWTAVSQGYQNTCGIAGSTLYCWGAGGNQLGLGYTYAQYETPQAVAIFDLNVENATDEIGQYASQTSTATVSWLQNSPENGANALSFWCPVDITMDPVNHYFYAGDACNARILVYPLNTDNSFSTASGGHTASYVLGQSGFSPSILPSFWEDNCTASTISNNITSLAFDPVNSRLFVVGSAYSDRVMIFDNMSTPSNNMAASYVLGETALTNCSFANTPTQSTFGTAWGAAYDAVNQRLFVSDSGWTNSGQGNRVLVFNVAPSYLSSGTGGSCSSGSYGNGENACYVLGQSNFTNTGTGTSSTTVDGVDYLAFDPVNQRLFVSDTSNNRVLVYNVAPSVISNGEAASYVLGEPDFVTSTGGCAQNYLGAPGGIAYDTTSNRLFVYDGWCGSVVVFNVGPGVIQNGENASFTLGHNQAFANSYCGGNVFNCNQGSTTQNSFNTGWQASLNYDPGSQRLFVVDGRNNRIMIFDVSFANPNFFPLLPD